MSPKVIERPTPEEYAPAFEPLCFAGHGSRRTDGSFATERGAARHSRDGPGEGERYRYAPGKWSVRELVGHLIDTERIMAYRAVCVARGETASLPGFDENAYVANATFDDYPLPELLNEFVHVREGHLGFFRHLHPEAWLRTGLANHNPISVRALAWVMVGHVRHHMAVLQEHYLPHLRT